MVRKHSVRLGAALGAVALVALVAQLAGSAPVVGTGAFESPGPGQPKDVWLGPNTTRVGAKVTVTSGTAKMQQVVGTQPPTGLGLVTAGNSILWEGDFEKLQVVAMLPNTVGSWENRAPIGGSDPDRLVGEGSITSSAYGVMTPYMSQGPVNRMIVVTAGAFPVTVRTSSTGADLLMVDPGDSGFLSQQGVTTYCVAGNGTVLYRVYDVAPSCGPYGGSSSGKNGDLDAMAADGTKNMSVTVTNAGPGSLTVVSQVVGSAQATTSVPPQGNHVVSGMLIRLDWTVQDADPNRVTTVNYSIMGR